LVQHTKTGEMYQMTTKYAKLLQNIPNWYKILPNGRKIDPKATKFTNIFDWKTLQKLPQLFFFG
jgi:hypothetical protein